MRSRKKLFGALLVSTFLLGAVNVSAMEVNDETSLIDCLSKVGAETCVLKSNIDVTSQITTKDDKVLDLGTNSINGNVTLNEGLIFVSSDSKLTINATTGKINSGSKAYAAIQVGSNSELIVNGGKISGYWYGIAGNGGNHNTKITINGADTVIESDDINTDKTDVAIYHPQEGVLTINNGLVEGSTGIEIRAGKLVLNGGLIRGTNDSFSSNPNGNGTTTVGAGIAVVQHTTKKAIDVKVVGGTIEGHIPFYENNPQNNSAEDIAKIKLSIEGGTFRTTGTGTKTVETHDIHNYISGGTFMGQVKPSNDDLVVGAVINSNGSVAVYKVTLNYDENLASVTMTPENPKPGDKVTIQLTLKEAMFNGYGGSVVLNDLGNNKYEFTMPENDVLINFSLSGFETEYFVYTEKLDQDTVNLFYEENKGFNVYFSENTLEIVKNTLASLVEDLDSKSFYLSVYAGAEEIDFEKRYDEIDDNTKKLYDGVKKLLPNGNYIIGGVYTVVESWDNKANAELVKIDKFNEKVTYYVQLPDAYKGKSKYYGLARVVDGKLEVIRGTLSKDGKTIAFNTDKLGSFIFVYGDIANPATYDGILVYAGVGLLSIVSIIGLTFLTRKKVFNK